MEPTIRVQPEGDILAEPSGGPTQSPTLQDMAKELGVNFYSFFKLVSAEGLCFPLAEVYEAGTWRDVVIGGRPYWGSVTARQVMISAEAAQAIFLKAMYVNRHQLTSSVKPKNPIDDWPYCLEADSDYMTSYR